jgi:hypothetical protein
MRTSGRGLAWCYRNTRQIKERVNVSQHDISRARFMSGFVAALGAIALVPAVASASMSSFGSSLNHTPANAGSTCAQDGVGNPGDICTHVGSDYPGFSGHAQSPVSGTITALKLRPQGPMTFRAKVVQRPSRVGQLSHRPGAGGCAQPRDHRHRPDPGSDG